jgi:hypothetical protein
MGNMADDPNNVDRNGRKLAALDILFSVPLLLAPLLPPPVENPPPNPGIAGSVTLVGGGG